MPVQRDVQYFMVGSIKKEGGGIKANGKIKSYIQNQKETGQTSWTHHEEKGSLEPQKQIS